MPSVEVEVPVVLLVVPAVEPEVVVPEYPPVVELTAPLLSGGGVTPAVPPVVTVVVLPVLPAVEPVEEPAVDVVDPVSGKGASELLTTVSIFVAPDSVSAPAVPLSLPEHENNEREDNNNSVHKFFLFNLI